MRRSALALATLALASSAPLPLGAATLVLHDDWRLRTSASLEATGDAISRPSFDVSGWTAATVPTTVLAALVKSGEIVEPYFGRNLEKIPPERFAVPWWYRTEFELAAAPAEARLVFDGINYRADVWLNGVRIGGRDEIAGSFRVFELDVTPHLVAGRNVLAVEVAPPVAGEPTIGFVDWNPEPPDRNMGLWREVKLRSSDGVSLDDVFVRSELPSTAQARLSLGGRLRNRLRQAARVELRGSIRPLGDSAAPIAVEATFELQPGEERSLALDPRTLPQLVVERPRLWWPVNLGEPNLYRLELEAVVGGRPSDRQQVDFGIRKVEDYLNDAGHRGYAVNGRRLLIRGGGWVDDLLLSEDARKLEDEIRYVRHMNLNTIRLEGFWGSTQRLYELADRYGILVMVGWSCQWEWQDYLGQPVDETFGGIDTPAEMDLVSRSLHDQIVRLRNHPSVLAWVLASDMLPRPDLERRYRAMLAETDPTRPALAACSVRTSEVSGPTAVKMNGPYEWEPPDYWYVDRERGGAYGFNTETGPGAQPSPAASLRRMLPREHWWPIDGDWDYHCGRHEFKSLDRYRRALERRYGAPASLDEFAQRAQLVNYEAMRGMFEAFSLRRPLATGVVQWMLNSAWPDLFWQLYDWYLTPNGAFYAARNSGRPVHVAYDPGKREIVVVNDSDSPLAGVTARVRVLDVRSRVLRDEQHAIDVATDSRAKVATLPKIRARDGVYFLDLRLTGRDGATLASNFYWLAERPDELDWAKSEWFYTPVKRYADFTALTRLAPAEVTAAHRFTTTNDGLALDVTLENPGDRLAFFIELEVMGSHSGYLATPILWDDNYVSLLPGESRRIHATLPAHALQEGDEPVFRYRGINVRAPQAAAQERGTE